ncbi:hypothetical protein AFE_1983 [Acidithiobacillus ferrooxidans ATCC 23270]|uniref:Uncharacterized protein n=2 Tax=root TaxID=1 RepID=B7JC78_ACIF2|nr:hypothetical protein AFE_1983 [Acidithiobacillus ferrooxidans ATCC 23270]
MSKDNDVVSYRTDLHIDSIVTYFFGGANHVYTLINSCTYDNLLLHHFHVDAQIHSAHLIT